MNSAIDAARATSRSMERFPLCGVTRAAHPPPAAGEIGGRPGRLDRAARPVYTPRP
jgi:hypothetical protein